jgi:tetratricopeptide (TPR) repeat protein
MELNSKLDHYETEKSEEEILIRIRNCKEAKILEEWDINILGYDYLMERNKPKIAECIFRANTILYPNSANTFDSYAESLMLNGNLEASLKNYQKAVDIAVANEDGNIEFYQKNLESVKQKLKGKE